MNTRRSLYLIAVLTISIVGVWLLTWSTILRPHIPLAALAAMPPPPLQLSPTLTPALFHPHPSSLPPSAQPSSTLSPALFHPQPSPLPPSAQPSSTLTPALSLGGRGSCEAISDVSINTSLRMAHGSMQVRLSQALCLLRVLCCHTPLPEVIIQ